MVSPCGYFAMLPIFLHHTSQHYRPPVWFRPARMKWVNQVLFLCKVRGKYVPDFCHRIHNDGMTAVKQLGLYGILPLIHCLYLNLTNFDLQIIYIINIYLYIYIYNINVYIYTYIYIEIYSDRNKTIIFATRDFQFDDDDLTTVQNAIWSLVACFWMFALQYQDWLVAHA